MKTVVVAVNVLDIRLLGACPTSWLTRRVCHEVMRLTIVCGRGKIIVALSTIIIRHVWTAHFAGSNSAWCKILQLCIDISLIRRVDHIVWLTLLALGTDLSQTRVTILILSQVVALVKRVINELAHLWHQDITVIHLIEVRAVIIFFRGTFSIRFGRFCFFIATTRLLLALTIDKGLILVLVALLRTSLLLIISVHVHAVVELSELLLVARLAAAQRLELTLLLAILLLNVSD